MPSIVFKEWLPDQPELGNGGLLRAENVIPGDGGYEPYASFTANSGTVGTGIIQSGIATVSEAGVQFLYIQSGAPIYEASNNGSIWTATGAVSAGSVVFAQYDELVIAAGEATKPVCKTVGSSTTFGALATSGTAPPSNAIGVIGQFVVLGGLSQTTGGAGSLTPHGLQWSSIDQPRNWPVPGSATAIASQAGYQELNQAAGKVQAIHGGDQFGVILQEGAVTRMTYIGPPAVFQFDTIDNRQGSVFVQGSIKVGGITYFVSRHGFYKTDGVSVVPIGDGKVDRFFWSSFSGNGSPCWGYLADKNVIYFAFSITGSANLDSILAYNIVTGLWTYCREIAGFRQLITSAPGTEYSDDLYAFSVDTQKRCGVFAGAPGTAVIETGEMEFTEGGRTYIDAVKPHVESSGTAPSISVSVGYRSSLSSARTYSTTATPNSRTGFANMRVDARYASFETTITGNFEKATGLEFNAVPSGLV